MRKTVKLLHSIAACGLIGGLGCYMVLLVAAPQDTPAAYADLRQSIAVVSNWVLIPSLAVALVSGLLSMVVHTPFLDKGWVLVKAALGLLMFKGVLTIVGAKADYAAVISRQVEAGEASPAALDRLLAFEWGTLWVVMAISVANVVLGVWRPRIVRDPAPSKSAKPTARGPARPAATTGRPTPSATRDPATERVLDPAA